MKGGYLNAVALPILSCILFSSCVEKATYILPNHFEGKVEIIYNDTGPGSLPLKYRNGKRIFEIPSTGILKTSSKYVSIAKATSSFYYKKADGSFQPLQVSGKIVRCKGCRAIRNSGTISIDNDECYISKQNGHHNIESFLITFNRKTKY